MGKLLVITVGGTPDPVVFSINSHQPDYVAYIASKESRSVVRERIQPALQHQPKDSEIVLLSDAQDLTGSFKKLLAELENILEMWDVRGEEIVCDYTGGTKTMSAAVALALFGGKPQFSYVGGDSRNKAGLGVVENGKEQLLPQENPWDVLAIDELREIETLFNMHQYRDASRRARETEARLQHKKPFFTAIGVAADGYQEWDDFRHDKALKQLRQAESKFRELAAVADHESIPAFQRKLAESITALQEISGELARLKSGSSGRESSGEHIFRVPLDLVANAVRRAEQGRFDDAVARLYGAVEKIAKIRLKLIYGIDNSNVQPAQIPDEAMRKRFQEEAGEAGNLKLPLQKSFELLHALGDPAGEKFVHAQEEMYKLLDIRNNSILAHGFEPVQEKTYRRMLDIALSFLDGTEANLPEFPKMRWEGLGYDLWWKR